MSLTVLIVFMAVVNVQCGRKCQTMMDPSQNSEYHSRNLQSFQQLRDIGDTVVPGNQQSADHHDRTITECDPGDIAPTGRDCTAYYECVNGHYKLQLCPSDTFFNPQLKCCHADYSCPNRAYESRTTPSPPSKYGELRSDEISGGNHYSCIGDNRHFERRICPNGKVFDRALNRCISSAEGNRCQQSGQQGFESRNIAVGLACTENSNASGYNADLTDCRRYYQCAQGRWIRMQCPSNLVWNPASTVCDWPQNRLFPCH